MVFLGEVTSGLTNLRRRGVYVQAKLPERIIHRMTICHAGLRSGHALSCRV